MLFIVPVGVMAAILAMQVYYYSMSHLYSYTFTELWEDIFDSAFLSFSKQYSLPMLLTALKVSAAVYIIYGFIRNCIPKVSQIIVYSISILASVIALSCVNDLLLLVLFPFYILVGVTASFLICTLFKIICHIRAARSKPSRRFSYDIGLINNNRRGCVVCVFTQTKTQSGGE